MRIRCAAVVQDVGEGPPIGHDPWRPGGERAVDDTVLGDDPGQEQLGDDLDDARAGDATHAQLGGNGIEPGLVGPELRADDPEARLERLPVDPDALDRTRRGSLSRRDLRALERGPGGGRGGEQPLAVAQHDLRVRADVDDEPNLAFGPMRRLGKDHAGRVGADVARDAGQHVRPVRRGAP